MVRSTQCARGLVVLKDTRLGLIVELNESFDKQKKTISLLDTHITMSQRRMNEIEDYSVKLMEAIK